MACWKVWVQVLVPVPFPAPHIVHPSPPWATKPNDPDHSHTHTLTTLKHTFELETAGIKCNLLLIEGCTSTHIRWSSVPGQLQYFLTLIDGHSLTRMASSPWQLLHSLFEFCWRGEDSAKPKPLQQQRIWCLPRTKTITILQTRYKNRNPTKGSTTAAIMSSDAQSGQNTSVFVPELLKNTRNRRHTHTIQQTKKHTHARTQVNQQDKVCLFQESRQMGEEECHSGRSRRADTLLTVAVRRERVLGFA